MGNETSSQSHARSSFGGLDYTSASGLTNFANTTSFAVDKEVGTYSLCQVEFHSRILAESDKELCGLEQAMLSFDERGAGLEMEEHLGAGTVTTDHHRAHTDTEGPSVHGSFFSDIVSGSGALKN